MIGIYLNPNVVRNHLLFNQQPNEPEVRVAGGGVCDLDLFETAFNEGLEEERLLFDSHRVCEGLVSIPQVCGQPYWGFGEDFRRPLPVFELQGSVRLVSLRRVSATEDGERRRWCGRG